MTPGKPCPPKKGKAPEELSRSLTERVELEMKYLIIGNSAAAVGCVEGIRQLDRESPITLVSSEPCHTYSRPLISYLLCGKTDEQRMKYRPDDFYAQNGVMALLGRTAASLSPGEKKVILSDGEKIPYDRLMVSTGSSPLVPPIQGLTQVQNRFSFMTLADAQALEAALTPQSRVLIMGAGLIGLKCAEGIAGKAGAITVVDLADHVLPSILDADAAALVQKQLEVHGIQLVLGDKVEKFTCKGASDCAQLQSGKQIFFDLLVVCVGVRPNTSLVAQAGGEVRRGIVTDDFCRTTLTDIYAGGDCTESFDITTGQNRILALLPGAYMQGECAGINMAGGEKHYQNAIPMNAIGFFGLHMLTAGSYDGEAFVLRGEGWYKKLVVKDGLLKGFILLGDVARAGIYTALIREQRPLEEIDFQLILQKPQLMAFSRADREKMLAHSF